MSGDRIIITDARLPTDHFIMEGIDDSKGPAGDPAAPVFTVSDVSKVFFARSSHWLRWQERRGAFVLDGEPVGTERQPPVTGTVGARRYSLSDVEKMVHALGAGEIIDHQQMMKALVTVQAIANVWNLLDKREKDA